MYPHSVGPKMLSDSDSEVWSGLPARLALGSAGYPYGNNGWITTRYLLCPSLDGVCASTMAQRKV